MKSISTLCLMVCISLSATTAFGRGGMGLHHMSALGGASGTSPATPGTNSLGTALSSSGIGSAAKGPALGTDSTIEREEVATDRLVKRSICRGC
jgi:hypothetical protein